MLLNLKLSSYYQLRRRRAIRKSIFKSTMTPKIHIFISFIQAISIAPFQSPLLLRGAQKTFVCLFYNRLLQNSSYRPH